MNLPLIVGGAGLAAGLAVGVVTERMTHSSLEADQADVNARSSEWLAGANEHFGDEIEADRLRNRDLQGKIEDYELEHPKPGEVSWGRSEAGYNSGVNMPTRDGFWGLTLGAGGAGGGIVGGFTWALASESNSVTGSAVGAGLVGAGVGVAAGSIISNWTH